MLYIAVEEEKTDYIRELLRRRDVNPNLPNKVLRKFPLHVAVENGNVEVTKMLLNCGGDVNAKMENGNTALHLAAFYGSTGQVIFPNKC